MSTVKRKRRRRLARTIGRSLIGLAVLLALGCVSSYLVLRTSLPTLDGRVTLAGLEGEVEIVRDRHAIPYIRASNERDALFALGYVHAQDRLFQMEFSRRLGAGRLSEVSGRSTLGIDRFMRTLGIYHAAEEGFAGLSPATQRAVEAYTAGVNAYLATRKGVLPIEFQLLRILVRLRDPFGEGYRMEPWRPADSLVWGRVMALRLSGNFTREAFAARLAKRLGRERVERLFPDPDDGSVPASLAALPSGTERLFANVLDAVPDVMRPVTASNSWALAGALTGTGKPILANDPHLGFSMPNLWYLARIDTPDLTLAGATVAGVPFHILAHNRWIAWAFTTTESDTQDLFLERLTQGKPGYYDAPDGPRPFEIRQEIIKVNGGPDETLEVRSTRHGPVISDVRPTVAEAADPGYVVALATPALRSDDRTAQALYEINHARDWASFRDAARSFDSPQQNISYADVEGTIGLIAPARVPVRRSGLGLYPVPGWSGDYDWSGYIPFDDLPQTLNPPSGRIVNANNPVAPTGYKYWLGRNGTAPYRARRIYELLANGRQTVPTTESIQLDTVSLMAGDILPLMLARTRPQDAASRRALDLLQAWHDKMAADRPEPLIFSAWLLEFVHAVLADELGDAYYQFAGFRPTLVKNVLTSDPSWCDDVTTPDTETCAALLSTALATTLKKLSASQGEDMLAWRWGDVHVAEFRHPIFRWLPVIRDLFDLAEPSGGGAYTVNRAQNRVTPNGNSLASVHGPGYRAIYDLSDLDNSRFIQATGQSGNPLSHYYADLYEMWRAGRYLRLPKPEAADLAGSAGRLVLVPAS